MQFSTSLLDVDIFHKCIYINNMLLNIKNGREKQLHPHNMHNHKLTICNRQISINEKCWQLWQGPPNRPGKTIDNHMGENYGNLCP